MSAGGLEAALRKKLELFSVRFGPRAAGHARVQTVVLVQPGESLEGAFQLTKRRLDAGEIVCLVGPGVTLPRVWPPWVKDADGLRLAEWGAFRPVSQREATQHLQDELRAWVREVVGSTFGDLASDHVFFTAACQRFFQSVVTSYPVASALVLAFPAAMFLAVSKDAMTIELLRQLATRHGGRVEGLTAPPLNGARWAGRFVGTGGLALGASVARLTSDWFHARPTFRFLRQARQAAPVPRTWVALIPDAYRANHHLLDAFALPETEDGNALGILCVGGLAAGRRDEEKQREHHGHEVLAGVGRLRDRLDRCAVDQAAMPESPGAFARAIAVGCVRAVRVLRHLAATPEVTLPSIAVRVEPRALATWATIDVLRATLSEAAAKDFVSRVAMSGTTVIFIAGNNCTFAPVDLHLQRSGALTVDHPHGAGGDKWSAVATSESALRLCWTHADAQSAAEPGKKVLVTGMPVRLRFAPRVRPARNVLIMSSYVHRDSQGEDGVPSGDRYPWRIFQQELLDVARLLRERGHGDLRYLWRPHPGDAETEVQQELSARDGFELSRGRPLEEDLGWSDVVISSVSTVVIEALFASVPVFVHALPDLWNIPATDFLSRERLFFQASQGAALVGSWLDRFARSPGDGLAAEQESRRVLFGESLEPVPMTDYFGRQASRPLEPDIERAPCTKGGSSQFTSR